MSPLEIVMEQRNSALIAAADASMRHEMAARVADAAFRALHECITAGQVPADRVSALVASVPGFAEWRAREAAR